jgi:3-hydroxybutyryl-CoA dehydrogenase
MNEQSKIAIIGAGTMGHSIAFTLLENFRIVNLIDIDERALEESVKRIKYYVEAKNDKSVSLRNLSTFSDIEPGVDSVELVIETVPEDLDLKKEVFKKVDEICSDSVVITTNTSGIPIGLIADATKAKNRVIGTHFFYPVPAMPIVEVVRSRYTSDVVVDEIVKFFRSIGKRPLLVNKDVPGFIGNRLQAAMAREAISLVQKGVATPDDIDYAVRYIFGVRFPHTGILEQRDLSGLDVHLKVVKYLYPDLEDTKEPMEFHVRKVKAGEIGLKAGRGFFDWDEQSVEELMAKKRERITKVLDLMKAFEEEDNRR